MAGVSSSEAFVSDRDSYLEDLDFNRIFSEKRAEIDSIASQKVQQMAALADYDDEMLAQFKSLFIKAETKKAAQIIDPTLVIPPFLKLTRSRPQATRANFCFGVMPPRAIFGRS